MKKYLLILLIMSPRIISAQDIMSDNASECRDPFGGAMYGIIGNQYNILGSTATLYNGTTYVFNYITDEMCQAVQPFSTFKFAYPIVSTFSSDSLFPFDVLGQVKECIYPQANYWTNCITYFNYPDQFNYRPDLLAKVFTFNYNGRLWYFQTIKSKSGDSLYECFAQLPVDPHNVCHTYYRPYVLPSKAYMYVKTGAFQLDSSLYFIASQLMPGNNSLWPLSQEIQKYTYNAIKNTFELAAIRPFSIPPLASMPAGLLRRNDPSTGKDYIINCVYNPGTLYMYKLNSDDPGIVDTLLCAVNIPMAIGGVAIIQGSIQGSRDPAHITNRDQSDRFTIFTIGPDKLGTDWPVNYFEFWFDSKNIPHRTGNGQVINPIGQSPKFYQNAFSLTAAYELLPGHFTNKLSTYSTYFDGYQQNVWLFFPDSKERISGVGLTSDIWQPSPSSSDSIVTSNLVIDTGNVASQLRSLSTLVGIVDGGPPCSTIWAKWDSAYPPGGNLSRDPTELEISSTATQKIEYTNTTNDEFSEGMNLKIAPEFKIGKTTVSPEFGVGASFSQSFKVMHSTGTEYVNKYETGFPLNGLSQAHGYYIWAVPTITRYVYRRYPWWDAKNYDNYAHPVPNSLQYLFRTTGTTIINQAIPLQDFPFRVGEPNGTGLRDWTTDSVPYNKRGRKQIAQVLTDYPFYSKITGSTWNRYGPANNGSFESMVDTTVSNECENSFDLEVTAGVKVPKVFKLEFSFGYKVSYSNEVKTTSSFGHDIKLGINLSAYDVDYINNKDNLFIDLYMFRAADSIPYWYWDSIPVADQKPWYIAYLVTAANKQIRLISPEDQCRIRGSELLFTWESENTDESTNFTFIISDSWPVTPHSVIFSGSTGNITGINPGSFVPLPGKTYYWAVRGTDSSGQVVWSDPRSFSLPGQESASPVNEGLKALVYPNPSWKGDDIHISIHPASAGEATISLFRISGDLLYREKIECASDRVTVLTLPGMDLAPGIYIAEISSGGDRQVKKLIIL